MNRKASCVAVKKVNSQIRKKLRGALKDLKNDQPRSASSKLYQAGDLIRETTKGIWSKNAATSLASEATSVSLRLCNTSTMHWPKWKDRTEAMLEKLDQIDQKTTSRCGNQ